MSENKDLEAPMYAVHTYSGYENKVKNSIEKAAENRPGMQKLIQEVWVPVVEEKEEKNGKTVTKQRKVYPGYVFVRMIVTNESWYVIRNTSGVTGFVGSGTDPVPLTEEEVERMRSALYVTAEYEIGDKVMITEGNFEGLDCTVTAVDAANSSISGTVFMLGRETPVELTFDQVRKL